MIKALAIVALVLVAALLVPEFFASSPIPVSNVDVLAPESGDTASSAAERIPRAYTRHANTPVRGRPTLQPAPVSESTPPAAPEPAATPIPTATPVAIPKPEPTPTSTQRGTFTNISFESTLFKQADDSAIVEVTFSAELTGSLTGITNANLRCVVKATGPGSCNGTGSFIGTACVDSDCRSGTLLFQDGVVKIDGASLEGRFTIWSGTGGLENLDGVVTFLGTFQGTSGTGTYTAQVPLNGFR
jgi:hypothetical protein